jgi:hypothetical protein
MTCTDAQFESVLNLIMEGRSLRKACDSIGVSLHNFQYRLRSGGNEQMLHYTRALELRADVLGDDVIDIADNPEIDPNRARNQITARQWNAAKTSPKKFGERIDLNVSQSLDITAILTDARQRLRPVSDQLPIIEMQVIDTKVLDVPGASDNESDAASQAKPAGASIFD